MIANKRINLIVLIAVIAAVAFCIAAIALAPKLIEKYGTGVRMEYETRIFDHSEPVVIDIQMDPDEWQTMLDNATQEVYYVCDVVIDGTRFQNVGIRPKGNTSLSSIASNPNTERFSFKLEFDQFVDGQTAWGLDKLCLNNNYADATNMKEALFYDMYEFLGADASLYNYAAIYVNGEYWGVYLALEAVEDSFLLRNYGARNGELYKPDQMGMSMGGDWGQSNNDNGWGWLIDLFDGSDDEASGEMRWGRGEDGEDGESSERRSRRSASDEPEEESGASPEPTAAPDPMPPSGDLSDSMQELVGTEENDSASDDSAEEASDESSDESSGGASEESGWSWGDRDDGDGWSWGDDDDDRGGGFGGMFGGGGANLSYMGDDLSSYSTIWGCEVTTTNEADHRRVVQALKNISERVDLEESMDIDNLLRMMAVHNFSVNWDSLSGSMAHNYYLYESDGQLNILPWDYNLAFGRMGASDAKSAINKPIDDSWQSTDFIDPLLEDEEYLARYHEYYRQLVEEYIFGGGFDEFYDRTREQIDDLVAADPNALYDYDEYDAAAETLYHVVKLRGESILGQLDGTIPSTEAGQRADDSALIAADNIDLSLMGSMSMGGSFGGGGGWGEGGNPFRRNSDEASDEASDDASDEASDETSDEATDETSGEPEETASGESTEAGSDETAYAAVDGETAAFSVETDDSASDEPDDGASDEPSSESSDDAASDEPGDDSEASGEMRGSRSERSSGEDWRSASREMQQAENRKTVWLLAACGAALVIGLVFAAKFRKKG